MAPDDILPGAFAQPPLHFHCKLCTELSFPSLEELVAHCAMMWHKLPLASHYVAQANRPWVAARRDGSLEEAEFAGVEKHRRTLLAWAARAARRWHRRFNIAKVA